MSAGVFTETFYLADYTVDAVHPIRVQPETIAATDGTVDNDPPAPVGVIPISARVSGSRRGLGLFSRTVTMKVAGTPPTGYSATSIVRIPVLTPTAYAAFRPKGTIITYLGTTWTVLSGQAEVAR
jgi:hypothetical protein